MSATIPPELLFGTQVSFMLVINAIVARRYLGPWLERRSFEEALAPLLLLHGTRVVGLGFLTGSVTDPDLPAWSAVPAAAGDLATAALALLAYGALARGSRSAWTLALVANGVGILDLAYAIVSGVALAFPTYRLGPMWFVPTFVGPTMIVTHALMVRLLLRARARATSEGEDAASVR